MKLYRAEMPEVERGDCVGFTPLRDRHYGRIDQAQTQRCISLAQLAHIVHDLDMKDAKYDPPEAVAVGRMVEGLRALHADDATLLENGIGMFDALARSFESDQGRVQRAKAARDLTARRSTTKDSARTRTRKKGHE